MKHRWWNSSVIRIGLGGRGPGDLMIKLMETEPINPSILVLHTDK